LVTKRERKKTNATPPNQSSDKLLSVLEMMSEQSEPLRLQDVAAKCEMNTSTTLRFLSALQKRKYVAQDPDTGRYYITMKICALAHNVSAYNNFRSIALPFMRSVSNTFRESCNLAIENNMTIMYVEVANSQYNTLLSTQRIGNIAPMHCTGIGKLFLSEYSAGDLDQYVVMHKLTKFTDSTITDKQALDLELKRIAELGYAFDNQECEAGVRCIAVPVRDYTGGIHAGLSVSGPAIRMTDEHIYAHLDFLRDTAKQISMCMGWRVDEQ